MKKNKEKSMRIKYKGAWIPKWMLTIYGKYHARKGIVGNDDKGKVSSGYTVKKFKDYDLYVSEMIRELETKSTAMGIKIQVLSKDYQKNIMEVQMIEKELEKSSTDSVAEIRRKNSLDAKKKDLIMSNKSIAEDIINTVDTLNSIVFLYRQQFNHTSAIAEAMLASYAKGTSFQEKWNKECVPDVIIEKSKPFWEYLKQHENDSDYTALKKKIIEWEGIGYGNN